MEEGLSKENYLRLALRPRCGFCQITLTSCISIHTDIRYEGNAKLAYTLEKSALDRGRTDRIICYYRS